MNFRWVRANRPVFPPFCLPLPFPGVLQSIVSARFFSLPLPFFRASCRKTVAEPGLSLFLLGELSRRTSKLFFLLFFFSLFLSNYCREE